MDVGAYTLYVQLLALLSSKCFYIGLKQYLILFVCFIVLIFHPFTRIFVLVLLYGFLISLLSVGCNTNFSFKIF